jgi:hypothetical protein
MIAHRLIAHRFSRDLWPSFRRAGSCGAQKHYGSARLPAPQDFARNLANANQQPADAFEISEKPARIKRSAYLR